ncbi:MAG TPA: pyrophosphorylase [Microlunatus sp.]
MSSRVLSTEEAKQSIRHIQQIINGGLTEQISALDKEGQDLSNPNNWDGPLAEHFRSSTWPQTKSALEKAKQELNDLQGQLQKISTDIFTAGGGS